MLLFSLLLLPLLLTIFCLQYKQKKVVPVILMGSLASILLCAFKTFFTFSHRVIPYSLSDNFVHLLFTQGILPVLIVYALYLTFSRDNMDTKKEAFFPLEISFYSIYLPYVIISTSEGLYSWFSLFLKPLLVAAMIIQLQIFVNLFFCSLKTKKYYFTVLSVILFIGYIFVPFLLEAVYLVNIDLFMVLSLGIVYILVPVVLTILLQFKFLKK